MNLKEKRRCSMSQSAEVNTKDLALGHWLPQDGEVEKRW